MHLTKNNYFSLVAVIIIVIFAICIIMGISKYLDNNSDDDIINITESIDNTLVTVYALEGAYPSDLYYLSNYGMIFNDDVYYYDYQFIGYNIKPSVYVSRKSKGW